MAQRGKMITCGCCGYTAVASSYEDAFKDGWRFQTIEGKGVSSCPLCPIVCAAGLQSHDKAHAKWKLEGRPKEYSHEKCAVDGVIDSPTELRRVRSAHKQLRRMLKRSNR